MLITTLLSACRLVCIYDIVYNDIDKETENVLANVFGSATYKMVKIPKQTDGMDCGAYAIATMTALAHNEDPAIYLSLSKLKCDLTYIVLCFEKTF